MYEKQIKDTLETSRLRLRKFKHSDCNAVYKYGCDPRVLKYLVWVGITAKQEALACIDKYYLSRPGIYAIALKNNDLCIGAVEIRVDEENDKASFGYLLDYDYWNKGYMSEALMRVLEHCFIDLKLNRVEALHYKTNPASGKIMAECGMKFEGIGIQELKVKGVYQDAVHYGITQEMWQNQ